MKLGLILGDQLSLNLPTLQVLDPGRDRLVMAEVADEATYVPHHRQKIAFIFSAMRHFARQLEQAGWTLDYFRYGEHDCRSLVSVLEQVCSRHRCESIVVTRCGEYRLQAQIDTEWEKTLGCAVTCLEDSRFFCSREEFAAWAAGKKQLRMEFFYRQMRRKTGYLMDGDGPRGGKWNFDASNRKPWKGDPAPPQPLQSRPDDIDLEVLELVADRFTDHPGNLENFRWATTRRGALAALRTFVDSGLPRFGDFQDAMATGQDTLFHSLLSPYLNAGLLDPREVCEAAIRALDDGRAPLSAVEGFVRQILGWREFVRGIYWLHMPAYKSQNALGNRRPLPPYYWSGETGMHCMKECLRNTLDNGYAHHIQRLMVTGNFALLAGIAPGEVCDWYLSVYVDAYEWVELPNTLGMALHADGGYLGSKPYAASGSYIHRMSDYCRHCRYNVKTRTETDSCPFNSLYWHFIDRHRDRFGDNPRMTMVYKNLDQMDSQTRRRLLARAEDLLANLEGL